jgi:hypothetical protein
VIDTPPKLILPFPKPAIVRASELPRTYAEAMKIRTKQAGTIVIPFVAAAGGGGTWQTAWGPETLGSNLFHGVARTVRTVLAASLYSLSGSKYRLTLQGPNSGTTNVVACYAGHAAAAGDAYDFDGTQAQQKYGGSSTWAMTGGADYLLDEVAVSFDETKAFVFAIALQSGDNQSWNSSVTNATYYEKNGNDASTQDATGYSSVASRLTTIKKIEVFA